MALELTPVRKQGHHRPGITWTCPKTAPNSQLPFTPAGARNMSKGPSTQKKPLVASDRSVVAMPFAPFVAFSTPRSLHPLCGELVRPRDQGLEHVPSLLPLTTGPGRIILGIGTSRIRGCGRRLFSPTTEREPFPLQMKSWGSFICSNDPKDLSVRTQVKTGITEASSPPERAEVRRLAA